MELHLRVKVSEAGQALYVIGLVTIEVGRKLLMLMPEKIAKLIGL